MNNTYNVLTAVFCLLIASNMVFAQQTDPNNQEIELGKVAWHRDYDIALTVAKNTNKPIFILFQEVPGCSTCQNYGQNILSHPLLVDIIQNEFVPLTIFNNKKGADAKILKLYKEPSWNNPVVRIVNGQGKDILTRHASNYTLEGLASYMRTALLASGNGISTYADVLTQELSGSSQQTEDAYYSMYCFWTGEAKLGQIDGVLSSSPGFMNGHEVVKLTYDKNKIDQSKIKKIAKANQFTFVKDPSTFRTDRDEQYYLKKSNFAFLPLTPIQRTKINSALAHKTDATVYLSPTQKKWYDWISRSKPKLDLLYAKDFMQARDLFMADFQ